MTEKEVISTLEMYRANNSNYDEETAEAIDIILSMLEEKDKVIDLMAEQLTTPIHSKEWVKQYFENKAKEVE